MSRITIKQIVELIVLAVAGRVTKENFWAFLRNPQGSLQLGEDKLAEPVVPVPDECVVIVDNGMTIEQMMKASRCAYTAVRAVGINSQSFPVKCDDILVETRLMFVRLNRVVSTRGIKAHLEKKGLRPATLEELLAFWINHRERYQDLFVAVLGSSCVDADGRSFFPHARISTKGLWLVLDEGVWSEDICFLAVAK